MQYQRILVAGIAAGHLADLHLVPGCHLHACADTGAIGTGVADNFYFDPVVTAPTVAKEVLAGRQVQIAVVVVVRPGSLIRVA